MKLNFYNIIKKKKYTQIMYLDLKYPQIDTGLHWYYPTLIIDTLIHNSVRNIITVKQMITNSLNKTDLYHNVLVKGFHRSNNLI